MRARVLVSELTRRRPDISVRAFSAADAPGATTTNILDPIESLRGPDAARGHDLAAGLDVVIGSFDTADLDRVPADTAALLATGPGVPATYAAFAIGLDARSDPAVIERVAAAERVSLLDDGSIGAWNDRAARAPDAVLAHPALLATRWFTPRVLEARREFLRALRVWPADETHPVVVHVGAGGVDASTRTSALVDRPVVVVPDLPTDDSFPGVPRLPEMAGLEDQVAAISGAALVVTASPAVRALAHAFGVPCARPDDLGSPALAGDLTVAIAGLDAELDRLVALAPGPGPGPLAWSELAAARQALVARGHRLEAERVAFADAMVAERARYHELLQQLAEMQAGYDDIRRLEVVRLRVALGDLRRRMRFGK